MSLSRNNIKGITLIETLVSLSLLSFAIAGPMTLAAHSIKVSGAVRNELIATHFAEEGLEVVHNLRDNLSADDASGIGTDWMGTALAKLFENCDTAFGCVIDITKHSGTNVWDYAAVIIECAAGSCPSDIYINPLTGFYRQSGSAPVSPWARTGFKRTILMTGADNAANPRRQVRVTATVTYPGYGGIPRTIRVTQDVYNWFPQLP